MTELSGNKSRCDILKTEYNTDDYNNPKEIATLYTVFEYYKGGGRTESLHYLLIIRQRSKIVYKEKMDVCFEAALLHYCRKIRGRAQEWGPNGLLFRRGMIT